MLRSALVSDWWHRKSPRKHWPPLMMASLYLLDASGLRYAWRSFILHLYNMHSRLVDDVAALPRCWPRIYSLWWYCHLMVWVTSHESEHDYLSLSFLSVVRKRYRRKTRSTTIGNESISRGKKSIGIGCHSLSKFYRASIEEADTTICPLPPAWSLSDAWSNGTASFISRWKDSGAIDALPRTDQTSFSAKRNTSPWRFDSFHERRARNHAELAIWRYLMIFRPDGSSKLSDSSCGSTAPFCCLGSAERYRCHERETWSHSAELTSGLSPMLMLDISLI